MAKFERMAADRERQRRPKEQKVELLNETSYDRRRQVSNSVSALFLNG